MFKNFLSSITRNGMSLFGTGLAIAALVLIVCLYFMTQVGFEGGPYLGIITFLISADDFRRRAGPYSVGYPVASTQDASIAGR